MQAGMKPSALACVAACPMRNLLETNSARYLWLRAQSASVQDAMLRPPIPPELLESPEAWGALVDASIDAERKKAA